ncbi:hypothetical protein LC065_05560 [Halobacillus litoralis]|uniref:hypothetical protein n=1 Tax=Halobacillus litoralis TaxID=45668 RepID=UPI00273E52FC|nr:hypothetical protein [Halobacillus litoralis]WLR48651.1 hypothetical protein LC065_05560 [Halobacillus litoralis]
MEQLQTKPKTFAEILDHTFSISKKNFGPLFLTLLIIFAPLYIFDYLFMVLSGISLFREPSSGGFAEGVLNNLDTAAATQELVATNLGIGMEMLYLLVSTILAIIIYPIAQASVIVATSKALKNETWSKGQAIKGAFSRFWPLIGSTALMGVIFGAAVFIGFLLFGVLGGISFARDGFGVGFIMSIVFGLLFFAAVAFFCDETEHVLWSDCFSEGRPGLFKKLAADERAFLVRFRIVRRLFHHYHLAYIRNGGCLRSSFRWQSSRSCADGPCFDHYHTVYDGRLYGTVF